MIQYKNVNALLSGEIIDEFRQGWGNPHFVRCNERAGFLTSTTTTITNTTITNNITTNNTIITTTVTNITTNTTNTTTKY